MRSRDVLKATRDLARKIAGDDGPREQRKGPIQAGPRGYVVCSPCTRMFGNGRSVGVPVQRAKRHAQDHKLGLIRAVTS